MDETILERACSGVNLGENFAKSKISLNNFKKKIKDLKLLNSDKCLYIHECLLNLRNEIDIDREWNKAVIDKHYLKMIEEIDKIEAECKKKSENLKGDYDLKSFETDFERLKSELDKLEINIANWDNIAVEANQQVIKLDELIKRLKNEMLLDKAYSYLPIMHNYHT